MLKRFINPAFFGLWCLVILIWQLSIPVLAQAQPGGSSVPAPKRVLLLYTYGDGLPGYQKATPAFLSVTTAAGININDLFFEYLDLQRNDSAEYRQRLADLLRYKYTKHQVGLIVAVHTGALNFLLDEAKGLFPDAPVFSYLVVRPELIEAKKTGRRILQRPQNLDMRGTLEIALKMFPQTGKIVFVTGTAEGRLEHEAKVAFEPWRNKLEFQYTSDRSVEEILQLVASLPPQSIVIYCNVFSDKTGRTFIPREVGKMVAKAANAPVFCLWDTLMGSGVVGGSLLSFEAEGTYAANVALDILNGKVLLTRPVTTLPTSKTHMFDWRQLKRWGVNESILPKGSIVINRETTLWDFKYYIFGAFVFCFLETALIIILIVQRRRKKVAEESLLLRTEELDRFFTVSLDILGIANTEGYFLRLNPAAERFLGYTREELMSKPFLDFVHPDDVDRTREAISILASQEKVSSFENRYRCKDGTYRWLQWSTVPAGNLLYAAARDITERKQAEEALRQRNQYIETVLEQAPIGFAVHTIDDGVGRFVSARFEEIYGVPRGTIDSHYTFFDKVWPNHPDLRDEIRRRVVADMASGDASRMRWENVPVPLHSGKTRYVTAMNIPVLDQNLMVSTVQDVTERKEAEEELKKSEERFRMLIETMNEGFGIRNENGVWTYVNDQLCGMLGHLPGDIVGRPITEFLDEANRSVLEGVMQKQKKGDYSPYELTWTRTDGRKVTTIVSPKPVFNREGKLKEVFAVITNISERKRAEEELRTYQERLEEMVKERTVELATARDEAEGANRAKSTFLANMSHELRTPLNSILGIAQLMERDAGFPSEHRDTLKILSRSGAYLLELINDVLEMSKIEAGKTTLDATSFDPRSFLGDLEEMTRLRADQKGLKLFFKYESPLPEYIETDVRKLRQILINLLSNAIKYTEKGRVTLRVGCKGGRETPPEAKAASLAHLKFEIEDTGIGIAPEDRQRIFEPFVQVNPGRAAREGTGLGLTLSRMFVEQLGGEITLRSQVGRGSTFMFDIPVKLAEGITIHTEKAVRQVLGLMPGQPFYRLLVVDDSVENRFTLRRLLEQCGFIVLEASGGQEAVELFESGQPHLIWMDLRMPGMDGYEAAQRIREAERGGGKEVHTPIIALTAGIMENKASSPLAGVFDDWVYKPFREAEIFGMLEKHLGVQFIYQPLEASAAAEKGREKGVTPAELAVLPVEWLREFLQVLRRGRSAQLNDLINRISPEHADLAGTLAELVHVYRFDHLKVATEGALKEASDG
jgi:PAS domain S-box-containing protein